tara:strand:+ start:270 stop:395 length:126 start_codon:yes stop_codon:yes gene_type:complete
MDTKNDNNSPSKVAKEHCNKKESSKKLVILLGFGRKKKIYM